MNVETIIDWLTDHNTCFLIGAGCSFCAKKPLMGQLTEEVIKKLTPKGKVIIDELHGPDTGSDPTIEDVTNHLLRLQSLAGQRKDQKIENWNLSEIDNEIQLIQKNIVKVIGSNWESSEYHMSFLERLIQNKRSVRDIFMLNYDTVFEASIEELKFPYLDGFRGTENAHFDPLSYSDQNTGRYFNLYKLHGSINWIRTPDDTVRRRPLLNIKDTDVRHVIYPAEQKYIQTEYGVFEWLLRLFRERLKKNLANNYLVVLGYSFSDEHINRAIEDGMLYPGSNLTVFAFLGDSVSEKRKQNLREMAAKCDNRFNVFLGQTEYIGTALDKAECESFMKMIDLSRFENIIELLTGKKHG